MLVQYILNLDIQGFLPQISSIEDMANSLLIMRCVQPVGTQWANRFVQRRPKLKTYITYIYDFQRALCKDPNLINVQFQLVANMYIKYSPQSNTIALGSLQCLIRHQRSALAISSNVVPIISSKITPLNNLFVITIIVSVLLCLEGGTLVIKSTNILAYIQLGIESGFKRPFFYCYYTNFLLQTLQLYRNLQTF